MGGADFLQYLITDKVVVPKELHHCYSEKLALMPNCYFVNDYKQSHQDVIRGENTPSRRDVGLPEERIIFTNVVQKDLHIKRSGLADVFLDTPLCNAHTTGCDVLWSGCPMITLPLRRMASRVAASLVHSAGCPELIVQDHAEYEELAVRLGLDHKYRHKLREKLKKARMSYPLFNTKMWVKNFEKVFTKMWQLHGQRKKPETF